MEEDPQGEEIIARVAAVDIGKAELVCWVRVPHEGQPGRRLGGGGELLHDDGLTAGDG